jgi:hypothetical protein
MGIGSLGVWKMDKRARPPYGLIASASGVACC